MVTVFTPTYNRLQTLERLYCSLCRQTDKGFEWVVIDDGSSDGTDTFFREILNSKHSFPVSYRFIPNRGKHFAINMGVKLASYEAFFIVDSDDYLTENAIEFINDAFISIEHDSSFAGIAGLRLNKSIPKPEFSTFIDATNLERNRYGLMGDKAEVYKTSVLKQYPFPYYEGETFLTEEVIWNKIAYDGLKIRWYNRGIYYCEYLDDGLTFKGKALFVKNPLGWARWIKDSLSYGIWQEKQVFSECLMYYEFRKSHNSPDEICELLGVSSDDIKNYNEVIIHNQNVFKQLIKAYKKISVYGYGKNGMRIANYFSMLGERVQYCIDKRRLRNTEERVYLPTDLLPQVELILISIKDPHMEITELLKNKLSGTDVLRISETDVRFFD